MTSDPFADRKYIKRRDDAKNHSWQFQFENDPIKESKNFSDSIYGSKEAAFVAAKAYRDAFLSSAVELGLVAPDGSPYGSDLPINLNLSPRNTSGIIGLYREDRLRKDKRSQEVAWIANFKTEAGKHDQKSFPVRSLGEKQALCKALEFRRDYVVRAAATVAVPAKRDLIENHVQDLNFLLEYIASLVDESEVFYFLSTINNPLISATEKQDMLAVRIGQQRFRKLVLAVWHSKCAITGATQFLTAGHIKPWADSSDAERIDPYNGIALSPVYDKAFDSGHITFDDDGRILISPLLSLNAPLLGITGREVISGLSANHLPYLAYHRSSRFLVK
jgi:putative restriction endonuclease